jgi:hypothetical protein
MPWQMGRNTEVIFLLQLANLWCPTRLLGTTSPLPSHEPSRCLVGRRFILSPRWEAGLSVHRWYLRRYVNQKSTPPRCEGLVSIAPIERRSREDLGRGPPTTVLFFNLFWKKTLLHSWQIILISSKLKGTGPSRRFGSLAQMNRASRRCSYRIAASSYSRVLSRRTPGMHAAPRRIAISPQSAATTTLTLLPPYSISCASAARHLPKIRP